MAMTGGQTGTLKGRERELAALMASGVRYATAAQTLGVSERTVERWAVKDHVQELVETIRDERVQVVVDALGDAGTEAVTTLRGLLTSAGPMVQLGAARAVLEFLLRAREQMDLTRRIAELERDDPANPDSATGDTTGGPAGGPAPATHPGPDPSIPRLGLPVDDTGPVATGLTPEPAGPDAGVDGPAER